MIFFLYLSGVLTGTAVVELTKKDGCGLGLVVSGKSNVTNILRVSMFVNNFTLTSFFGAGRLIRIINCIYIHALLALWAWISPGNSSRERENINHLLFDVHFEVRLYIGLPLETGSSQDCSLFVVYSRADIFKFREGRRSRDLGQLY